MSEADPTSQPTGPPAPSSGAVPVLLLIVLLSLVGFGVVIPLLPFFASAFDATPWQVTLLFSVYSAGQFMGELFWGRLSDRIGRRPVLLITIVGAGLGYVALAYSPTIWIAILARAAAGFFSGNMSVIQGYIVDISPKAILAHRLGLVGSAFNVGFVIGPALGGLMARPDLGAAGFQPPLLVSGMLCGLAAVGILIFVRESRAVTTAPGPRGNPFEALGEAARHPVLKRAFATIFLGFFASSSMWSVLGLWAQARFGWGPREVGLLMACTGVTAAFSQGLLSGMLVRRFGAGATIVAGLTLASTCLFLMAAAPVGWLAGLALAASVIGNAAWQPAATSLVSRSASPERQGAFLGAGSASGSAARVAGPVLGGAVFSAIAPWAPIATAALLMLPAAWLGWRAAEALRRHGDHIA
ncbi:MAG: MFS transporter [Phenylobacterium sp.]|uniref:MFS transporter n=1 Tax=Phenylobacterium sp. TaxID=1871053 RepID=UPI001A48F9E7|nr:MFS transporter [Phenylobacterium sp.]MBL8554092.1 MFS transporter [Phenylobacterium sp.]